MARETMKNAGPKKKVHFFQVAPFYYFPLIIVGITLTTILTGFPDLLPYSSLGYLGIFLHYIAYDQPTLMTCICCAAYVCHVLNAGFAYHFSRKLNLTNNDTIKWCMQSFILGYPSTRLLRAKLNKSQ